jgi:hypothetical protein
VAARPVYDWSLRLAVRGKPHIACKRLGATDVANWIVLKRSVFSTDGAPA